MRADCGETPNNVLDALVSASPLPIVMLDCEDRVWMWNPAAEQVFGWSKAEVLGQSLPFLPEEERERFRALRASQHAGARQVGTEVRRVCKDGKMLDLNLWTAPVRGADGAIVGTMGILVDATERKRVEQAFRRLNRLHAMLSKTGQLIIRAHNRQDLFERACRIAVEDGGFEVAWVGLADSATGRVNAVASAGIEAEYVSRIVVSFNPDVPEGHGPCGTAIREERHVIYQDLQADPRMEAWRAQARERGYGSGAAFPLRSAGKTVGAFSVYAAEARFFSEAEVRLLDELADGISHALDVLEREDQRRAAEEALRQSEARFRALAESVPGAAFIHTGAKYLYANAAMERITGYSRDELFEMPFWQGVHPDYRDLIRERARARLSGEPVQSAYEAKIVTKAGEERWILISETAIEFEGQPAILGTFLDVTDLKRAQEAAEHERSLLRTLVDAMPDYIYIKDSQSRFVLNNQAHLRLLHATTQDEVLGKTDFDIFPIELATRYYGDEQEIVASGRPLLNREEITQDPEGNEQWVLTSKVPIRDSYGHPIGVVGISRDITEHKQSEEERRKLEAQVQHAQKLESLGVLAGGIAHDFNNILTAILGNADLALMELPPGSSLRRYLDGIETASRRAAGLCQQMLAYSGKGQFLIGPTNLNEVVREMTHMLEVSISKKALLRYHLASDLPAIEADATQMRQVLMNLITNASEALGEKPGVISVTTDAMMLRGGHPDDAYQGEPLPPGRYVCLEVEDTGCGMDEQTRARLFDPFFTTKFTGRGLGMAAVLGIVRGHQGAIKVSSRLGLGSTIRILFPASDRLAPLESALTGVPAWQDGVRPDAMGTILLVDDEEPIREVAREMCEHLGFHVLTASDGQESLEVYRAHQGEIVCVLLDLTMPRMDGEETYLELRRINKDVPVIMSSGYSEQEITRRFADKGIAGFIQKPYKVSALKEVLGDVVRT